MTIDLYEIKALAEAAMFSHYLNPVARAELRMTMTPEVTLELITEIERHRLTNTEGCKPESSPPLPYKPHTGSATSRNLDNAEGGTPDSNIRPHPDDMLAIIRQRRDVIRSTNADLLDAMALLQDQTYALGFSRGRAEHAQGALQTGLAEVLPTVAIEGDQLVIRITTECLLHAVTCSSQWPVDEAGSPISINNGPLLVQEIIHELQRGDELGANPMHHLFDEAALAALDNGSEAVDYNEVRP